MTNALIAQRATDMLAADKTIEIKSMAHKLMKLTPGGRNLNADQAVELAVYCYMTDLNPFNGEAYYMPNVGVIPGVSGIRRKANEYLALTSSPDDRFFIEFRDANPGEGDFDTSKGDIAQIATLKVRSVSERWQQMLMGNFQQLIAAKMPTEKAWERAEKMAGNEPEWTACGVVDHREIFGRKAGTKGKDDKGTPDKWDRMERCKKRAEKWAIRKAFPTVILPDRELGEGDMIDAQFVGEIVNEIETEPKRKPRPEKVILNELGYETEDDAEPTPEPNPTEEPTETEDNGVLDEDEILQAVVDAELSENINAAEQALKRCKTGWDTIEKALTWMTSYRAFRDMGGTVAQSAKQANEGIVPK